MSLSTENQAVVLTHKGRGIASFIIGATCIIITLLLVGIAMSETELPRPMIIALGVLSSGMLCAALIGIALGFFGAKDRSSRNLYPLLGLTLNVTVPIVFVALALIGLSMKSCWHPGLARNIGIAELSCDFVERSDKQ